MMRAFETHPTKRREEDSRETTPEEPAWKRKCLALLVCVGHEIQGGYLVVRSFVWGLRLDI